MRTPLIEADIAHAMLTTQFSDWFSGLGVFEKDML